ncbi:hypothetical protein LTR78_007422 [Recurvomyces mirabilis]|uniref:Uncharacterized protein n=1 Tax=Recurvomyces mirabilis TaxID=574656 RepID=A0AAE0TRR9_9PEZI|nr:hypothetical protein LTR78_007422 [Recurvomyces mirabilis]KAK5160069.1 hypothetical protein LTS14_002175 [Recurvomyces mirabilis]
MASTRKTYFLAPSWDIGPAEIALGSVVANPKVPHRPLSAGTLPDDIDSAIVNTPPADKCSGFAKLSGAWSLGLFATFVHFVTLGGKLAHSRKSASEIRYSCDTMGTRRFVPSSTYVTKAAHDKGVQAFLSMGGPGSEVFVITGIKTGYNITITTSEGKDVASAAQLGVDIPIIQTTVGPKAEHRSESQQEHRQHIEGPIVFAYQLERLRQTRKGAISNSEHTSGAMLGQGATGEHHDNQVEIADTEWTSVALEGLQSALVKGIDEHEDEQDCSIVVPDIVE